MGYVRSVGLFVDDLRLLPPGYDLLVQTVPEAIKAIENNTLSKLSLDHDLGDPVGGDGYKVLDWIEERVFTGRGPAPFLIRIHTGNFSRGLHMLEVAKKIFRRWLTTHSVSDDLCPYYVNPVRMYDKEYARE